MGGNALSVAQVRLSADRYRPIEAELVQSLSRFLEGSRVDSIRAYAQKPDFGDLDILVEREVIESLNSDVEDFWSGLRPWIEKVGGVDITPNKDALVSFGFPLPEGNFFQVDVIQTPACSFETCCDYFAWNDLGNLMGSIAKAMGMKFGQNGLLFPLLDGSHLIKEVLISNKTSEILPFLGYDYARWSQGFETLEDVFRFASSSPYFNPAIFDIENLNNKNRVRNKKRKTYMAFLDWLSSGSWQGVPFTFPEDQRVWVQKAETAFPEFSSRLLIEKENYQKSREVRRRFNGRMVSEWTGLTGSALGLAVERVKTEVGQERFADFVLSSSENELKTHVLRILSQQDLPNTTLKNRP